AAADRHGPAAQRRVVALLDRGVERVHVDVDDLAHGRAGPASLGAQTCSLGSYSLSTAMPSSSPWPLDTRVRNRVAAWLAIGVGTFSSLAKACTMSRSFSAWKAYPARALLSVTLRGYTPVYQY